MPLKPKFKSDVKIKCLLWCDRHCCLCRKNCGPDIELAHINRKLTDQTLNEIDNAMPLCYECHAKIGHYNNEEPRGNKYTASELKSRREQVYEEFTRHLVPLINIQVTQNLLTGQLRPFPDVGFQLQHMETRLPVTVFTLLTIRANGKKFNPGGHYAKEQGWKMNPGFVAQGHFTIPQSIVNRGNRVSALVEIEVMDEYGRNHKLLPMEWIYEIDKPDHGWWANP